MSVYPEIEFQLVDFPSPPSPDPYESENGKRKWRRNHAACDACHARRVKCDMTSPLPCSRCQLKDIRCDITRQRRKRGRIPRSKKPSPLEAHEAPRWHVREKHTDEGSSPVSLPDLPRNSPPATPPTCLSENIMPDLSLKDDEIMVEASDLEFAIGTNATDDWLSMAHLAHDWPLPALTESSGSVDMSSSTPDSESSPTPSTPTSCQPDPTAEKMSLPSLKYPVLHSVMPFLEMQLSPSLACDLLELYFAVESPLSTYPACQNIQCHILRKASFMGETFRPTSMALLTSMLWIAASDNQVFSLSISPSHQRWICQFLGDLTKTFLSFSDSFLSEHTWNSGTRKRPQTSNDIFSDFDNSRNGQPIGYLDDLLACIHVASILSTEQNTTCKEWWQASFNLARKLDLNKELPVAPDEENDTEHREERRRTWWLLYIMDRHLALCYNRPLVLHDEECKSLRLPMNEISWQNGTFYEKDKSDQKRQDPTHQTLQDDSFFELFLPLMKITGDIVSLGSVLSLGDESCESKQAEILRYLDSYQTNLVAFMSSSASQTLDSETIVHLTDKDLFHHCSPETQLLVAYSSYLAQVLHILLVGKWDWPALLEEKNFFTSARFASTKSHILEASFWLQQILHVDPETRFMPSFFGTELLQGSFPVLLIIEKLQRDSGKEILLACEVMIRAIESCLVTRDEYVLRVFRRLLHGAVSQAWGRPLSGSEVRCRRRAISMLFLWVRRGSRRDTIECSQSLNGPRENISAWFPASMSSSLGMLQG